MSKYGYLELFLRVPSISRHRESTVPQKVFELLSRHEIMKDGLTDGQTDRQTDKVITIGPLMICNK